MTDDQQAQPDEAEASPTQAFDTLRREVAFMRRAIERMSDEQRAAPDYSETLGQMNEAMTRTAKVLDWLRRQPAITVTPQQMAQDIQAAGETARSADRRTIEEAARVLRETQRDLAGVVQSAQLAEAQQRQLWRYSWIAAAVGFVVGIVLVIAVARLVPEHSAAWLLGVKVGQVDQQLIAAPYSKRDGRQTASKQRGGGEAVSLR